MRRLFLLGAVTSLVAGLGLAGAPSAGATYPGRNGRLAFGLARGGNADVWSATLRGRPLRRLTRDPGFDLCPAYSADGRQIAFCSNRSGSAEIWAMDADGGDEHPVTQLHGFATFPDFSPDGSRIAFTWGPTNDPAEADIYTIEVTGGEVRRLTGAGSNAFPAYSPDGTRIAFISDRTGQSQVWVMNVDGSDQHQLTTADRPHGQLPDWSPDGTRIAYQEEDGLGLGHIFVINADGGDPQQLTFGAADDFGAAWSPRGDQIAFVREFAPGGDRPVFVMNADGTNQHRLTRLRPTLEFVPAWQPLVGARLLRARLIGRFAFGACPAGAPPGALCLHDDAAGALPPVGRVRGSFEVVIDAARTAADNCAPIDKSGSFVTADGDRLDVHAHGRFCFDTAVARYRYEVTGGTGRFDGATGTGTWLVPAPATFDGVRGKGQELLDGTLDF